MFRNKISYQMKPPLSARVVRGNILADFVAYWAFREGSGLKAFDSSGNGYVGTIEGAVWEAGKFGSVLRFDGDGDYVDLNGTATGGANPLELNDSFAISFLINFAESKSSYIINNNEGTGALIGRHINIHADPSAGNIQIKAHVDDNVNPTSLVSSVLNLNKWYHVLLVRDKGSTLKLYVDGVEDASANDITDGSVLSDIDWTIGAKARDVSEENFNGLIDNLMVFKRKLYVSEVALISLRLFCVFERMARLQSGFVQFAVKRE